MMRPLCNRQFQAGYILLPVMLLLALLALTAFLLSYEGGIGRYLTLHRADPDKALYVAEAGLQYADWQLQQANCENYADIGATPFGDHSFSATISPKDGSPVDISATGTLASGISRTLNHMDVPVYEPPVTTVLQPDADQLEDTRIYEWKPAWNFGVNTQLGVDTYWDDSKVRSLLRFDLSAIPVSAKILSAVLELHSVSSADNGGPVSVHRVTRDWDEGAQNQNTGSGANWNESSTGVLWSAAGGDFEPAPVTITNVPGFTIGWHSWDITSLMVNWQKNIYPNQGLMLKLQEPDRGVYFYSSDYSGDPAKRPKLTVTYACECGGGPSQYHILHPDGGDGQDTYLDYAKQTENFGAEATIINSNKLNSQDRGILRFDLSWIPAGTVLNSAVLQMNLESIGSGTSGTAALHRITADWQEMDATWKFRLGTDSWTTGGGDYDPLAAAAAPIDPAGGPVFWDITGLVTAWVDAVYDNYGMIMLVSPDINNAQFSSSDAVSKDLRPKLIIKYTCPCGSDCLSLPTEEFCDALFTPTGIISEYPTTPIGLTKPHGLAFLPEGMIFRGTAAPAGGAWLSVDWTRNLYMTDMSDNLLQSCVLDSLEPSSTSGITFVQSGLWAGHLAITGMQTDDQVYFVDLDCGQAASFPTLPFGSYTPSGISYIGTTASGSYDGYLAVADYFNDAVYIVDQAGALQATLDLSPFIGQVHGVAHLPGSDHLLLADEETGHVFIIDFVNFSGAPLVDYDGAAFGTGAPTGAEINPLTCDHMLTDETAGKVVALNTGVVTNPSMTLISTADTWVYMNDPDANFGGNTLMQAGANAGWEFMSTLVEFDLATIPTGANVQTATLRLYVDSLTGNQAKPVGLYRVSADWIENEASWNKRNSIDDWTTPGGDFDPAPLDVPTIDWSSGWKEWQVDPGLIHEWLDGFSPNYGLLLYYQGDKKNFFLKFATREHSEPSLHPQLVIEYTE